MQNIFTSILKRRSSLFLISVVLTLTMLSFCTTPALAARKRAVKKAVIPKEAVALKKTNKRWIQISLSKQRLFAWEGDKQVRAVIISTGKKSTPTKTGTYAIQSKHRLSRMKGPDYDVPDVPYTMYYDGGYAIHGAYWHRRFGTRVSHGCTNVAVDHAKWLYNWAGVGTPIVIHK